MKAINLPVIGQSDIGIGHETIAADMRKAWVTPTVILASARKDTNNYTVGFGTDFSDPTYGPFGS